MFPHPPPLHFLLPFRDCKNNAGSDAKPEVHSDFKFHDFKESECFSFFLPICLMTKYLSGSFFVHASPLKFLQGLHDMQKRP